jgi:hypothetical protein
MVTVLDLLTDRGFIAFRDRPVHAGAWFERAIATVPPVGG